MELYKIVVFISVVLLVPTGQKPVRNDLLVAAAASLSIVAPALTQAFHDVSGIDLRFNFAGSNTLARQIVEGARVDAFISADEAQLDVVERAGRVVAGTRADIVSNQLVVIAPLSSRRDARKADDLASPQIQRVAMGDPAAVPAGVYARRWLETIRLWALIEPKVVPLPSSPSVVAAIAAGRADFGIVYRSDLTGRQDAHGVHVAYDVPVEDVPRIVYPAAVIAGGRVALAREFITFLQGARAQAIFAAAGFRPLSAR